MQLTRSGLGQGVAVLALAAGLSASAPLAFADGEIGAVFAFNRICYAQVPNTRAIENMALQLGWNPLSPSQMKAFGEPSDFDYFKGWDVQFGEEFYRVGLTQNAVPEDVAARHPGFENGTSTSCSLVLGGAEAAETIAAGMRELAGKEPVSSAVPEGDVLTTTWAGGNDRFKVFLFNKASRTGEGSILNVTLISKE